MGERELPVRAGAFDREVGQDASDGGRELESVPVGSDASANRIRIVALACAAVATEGFDAPIREIAWQAQVGPATVYRHFPTKDALLAEALASCSTVVEEGLAAADP